MPAELRPSRLLFGRKRLAGSLIGGIPETRQMLDFRTEHEIAAGFYETVETCEIQAAGRSSLWSEPWNSRPA